MNKIRIKIFLGVLISILIVYLVPSSRTMDNSLYDVFNKITGERKPDTSIVIIHISGEDIEQLGPWPIKRNYYALLVNYLNHYNVKSIGFEIFLSPKFVTQSVYDNVLYKEILKSKNFVLSSAAGSINEIENKYFTDSLSYSTPKLINEKLKSGHVNFIRDNGIIIPLRIKNQNADERAFSFQLTAANFPELNSIKVNFIFSWHTFKKFSLLEFFELARTNSEELKLLNDKIILIGVSDPQLTSTLTTVFDDNLPGVALHAFALDNMLQKRFINDKFYDLSRYLIILLLILILFISYKKQINSFIYLIILPAVIIIFFALQKLMDLQLAYTQFLIPMLVLILFSFQQLFIERKKLLFNYYNEAELLKNLLKEKEKELLNVQNELEVTSDASSLKTIERIRDLKKDINRLKENESDKKVFEINGQSESRVFQGIVYRSDKINEIVKLIEKVAPTDATVLIQGESGTGKELIAKAIHNLSKRNNSRFVAVNCAALTETLLESELFGHVKGAFTGALNDKAGKFELADKGTIFLDEIGETSENFQVKLLRILQSGEYDKVGSEKTNKTDTRVVAATNKDIKQLIKERKFREDLYFRLNVIVITIPPLRDRKEDIDPVVLHYLNDSDSKFTISVAALNALTEYDWQGNIRELESVIKRAKILCESGNRNIVQLSDLPDEIVKNKNTGFEDIVIESLRNKNFSHSSINETAKELGNLNRTIISENFRGYVLKIFVDNHFDRQRTVSVIADTDNNEVIEKVNSKLEMWLSNIEKDVAVNNDLSFQSVRSKLSSKYKNLPQKFHKYLDEVIKQMILKKN